MKFATAAVLASAALPAALAQTWTACNPLNETCPCDPALGTTYTWDFRKGASDVFTNVDGFKISYESDGVHLPVGKKGDAPTLTSTKFILGGKLECVMKIAPGKGIVSSMVFESDDLDEIDFEWIGSQDYQAQTNYFGKGNTEQYNRGGITPVKNAATTFHTYTVDWTQDAITWYIDGTAIRTLTPAQSNTLYGSPNFYPQTPMQIKLGAWAAGDPSNAPGVVEWSDGPINYKEGPFAMVIQSVTLTDYTTGGNQYCYGDKSGSWGSIKVSNDPNQGKKSSSAAATPTASNKAAKETTMSTSKTYAPSTTSKKPVSTSTYEIAPAITQGVPDSIGGMQTPENKGVSSNAAQAQTTDSAAPTATAPPNTNSASSNKNTGFSLAVAAIFAAIVL
ncbi:Beta-glucanase [Arthrobotrys entomopaga]|nr:Beta-glucanase [Arthrobotrys entomopaga]